MWYIKEYEIKYNEKINNFIEEIYVKEYEFEEHRQHIKNADNSIYTKSGGNFWIVLDKKEKIIGCIGLFKHNEVEAEIKRFYVGKEYRGKGISKVLYEQLLSKCKQISIKKIFLGTYDKLEAAVSFYKKMRV